MARLAAVGIAAGIGDESGGADLGAVEFGQAVDGVGEKLGGGVLLFVPVKVVGGSAQAEGAAEIDDDGAGVKEFAERGPSKPRAAWRGEQPSIRVR